MPLVKLRTGIGFFWGESCFGKLSLELVSFFCFKQP